jgi:hypothetical protein
MAEGKLPDGYTVKKRKLVKVKPKGKDKDKVRGGKKLPAAA